VLALSSVVDPDPDPGQTLKQENVYFGHFHDPGSVIILKKNMRNTSDLKSTFVFLAKLLKIITVQTCLDPKLVVGENP
jgi:hypothetical protein